MKMVMKSYALFLFASVLLASASPLFPPSEDQELSSRSFETGTTTPLVVKRQNTESAVASLVRKMVEIEAYTRSLLTRAPPKNAKQIAVKAKHGKEIRKHDKAVKQHDKAVRKHDKAVAKHDAAIAKHDQLQLKAKTTQKQAKLPQAPVKNAVKTQGGKQKTLVKNQKTVAKNNKKKSSASALEPALSVVLFAKMLAILVLGML